MWWKYRGTVTNSGGYLTVMCDGKVQRRRRKKKKTDAGKWHMIDENKG
jgi:hypothetical protein